MEKIMNLNFEKIEELTKLDKKTLVERALKLSEEVGEVSEAVLSYSNACGCGYKKKSREDVIEECLDVIIVASSLISHVSDGNLDNDAVRNLYLKK
ncbi:MazG-like family protein [Clostridium senegalense]|uniref:MazG-like family protein n=2 Tax=Clostridium TaxID=1485 RepID=UPI0018FE7273|nr:MazG-like family protein [Clostridium senegalense]